MKYLLFGFVFVASGLICSGQAFRSGFYKREFSPGGGSAQESSFQSNVAAGLHNNESVFLIEQQDSTTKFSKEKWVIYIGGATNYMFPYTPYSTLHPPIFTIRPGAEALLRYRIHNGGFINTGVSWNQFNSSLKDTEPDGLGTLWEFSFDYSVVGIPLYYSYDFYSKLRIYPSMQGGLILNLLKKNEAEACYSAGCYTQNHFVEGSFAGFFMLGLNLNLVINKNLYFQLGTEYMHQLNSFRPVSPAGGKDNLDIARISYGFHIHF